MRWTGSMRDVTDRKDAEEALRKSEERFALAVAASNDGIWEVDVAGNQTFMSDRAQRLCGVAAGPSVRSRSAWRDMVFFNPGDFENLKAMFESYIKGQVTTFDGEWRVGHSDGNWRWVRIRGLAARDDTGRAVRIAGSISDIDSQKCAEAALQQAQRLEAVGTLAGGIAHDFNNILGAILGFGEMALRNTRAGSRMRRDVELIVKAGERGRTLVERVLAFSRTGFGERMPVQAEAVVNEVLHLISATLPEAVRIESRLLTGTAAILGDSTQLHQVVMNLVANAVQAMPTGGQLLVTLDNAAHDAPLVVTTGELAAGDYLVLTVADTGVGIPPEIVARIFDPFFTTREVDHGTGLGLSLVHGIVAEFGGKVNVATAIGSGSTFTVYLPRLGDVDEGEADSTAPSPRGANERVLVVDDERPLLTLVASALDNLGYRAFGYSSSLEALLAFKEDPDRFDALVTDERMPGLSGTALIHAVRELRPNFPTLLVSGYLGGDVVARARQASVDAVLGKPLATRELARALARALRLRKSQQYNTNGSSI